MLIKVEQDTSEPLRGSSPRQPLIRPLLIELGGERLQPRALMALEFLAAADRPAQLEMRLLEAPPYFLTAAGEDRPRDLEAGDQFRFRLEHEGEGRDFPRMRLEFSSRSFSGPPPGVASFVAVSPFQPRREAFAGGAYFHLRVGEIARRLSIELGLNLRLHGGAGEILPEFRVPGDPLRSLRRLAEEHGFGMALAGEELFFLREFPPQLGSLEWSPREGLALRKAYRLESGLPVLVIEDDRLGGAAILDRIRLRNWGARIDGDFRLLRQEIFMNAERLMSRSLLVGDAEPRACLNRLRDLDR